MGVKNDGRMEKMGRRMCVRDRVCVCAALVWWGGGGGGEEE